MLVKEFEGKSERDAIKTALEELGLAEEEVRIEVVDKGKRSILGIGENAPARVRVFYEEISANVKDIRETVQKMLDLMGFTTTVEAKEESEKRIYINVVTEDSAIIIGKKGAHLEAIQFLASLMFSKMVGDESDYHIVIDVDNYRKKREEALCEMAERFARLVKRTKRSKALEPMNPYERRIIHLALQDDDEVETKSEGEGNFRKIRILPKRKNGGRGDYRPNNNGYQRREVQDYRN